MATALWDGYDNDNLFTRRWKLSQFHSCRESISEDEQRELAELYKFFGVDNPDADGPSCTKNTVDMREYDMDNATRRWAALFVLLRLLRRIARGQKNWSTVFGSAMPALNIQGIAEADWMMAMFPIAQTPISLPFSESRTRASDFDSMAWGRSLSRDRGDFALNTRHVIQGYEWGAFLGMRRKKVKGKQIEEPVYALGLHSAERRILMDRALDTEGLGQKSDWLQNPLTRTIFEGEQSNE